MKHASLFSGIGGFDLAAEWMGWENVFHCELNPFCRQILKYYWPLSKSYEDIKTTDFTKYRGTIDILTGGFPCQPYSVAGKQLGTEDDRHLWPEMLRAIREIQPTWVVGENVPGLINWNRGLVFNEVQTDLETEGYEVIPFVLPACGVGAPHRRDRVWFVAKNSNENGRGSVIGEEESSLRGFGNSGSGDNEQLPPNNVEVRAASNASNLRCVNRCDNREERQIQDNIWITQEDKPERERRVGGVGETSQASPNCSNTGAKSVQRKRENRIHGSETVTDPTQSNKQRDRVCKECEQRSIGRCDSLDVANTNGIRLRNEINRTGKSRFINEKGKTPDWENFPTVAPVCNGDDGISGRLDLDTVFAGVKKPRKANTFSRWRNESIKAGGNAIVPHVVLQIFKAIEKFIQSSQPK